LPKRFRSDRERKAAFAHMRQEYPWSRRERRDHVRKTTEIAFPRPTKENEQNARSRFVIPPHARMVFETSFAVIAPLQPFIGQLYVSYKLVNAVYSVAKASEEHGLGGAAQVIGQEIVSAPLAVTQGAFAWNLIANRINPSFHVVAKSLLEECVHGLTDEEIDFVTRNLAR